MMAFIPVFFFASEYAQISLRKTASEAGLFLLYFFIGFVVAAQIGGRILDREGAKRAVVMGCAIAAVGFGVWASKVTHLSFSSQIVWIIVAGAGMGMMLGPANTDAINRASSLSYGEATGITQTIRNYGASLGLAVLGTILLTVQRSKLTASLQAQHVPHAAQVAATFSQSQGGHVGERHPPLLLAGLRLRHPIGPLRHVRDHGVRRPGGPLRPSSGGCRSPASSDRGGVPVPSDVRAVSSFFADVRGTLVPRRDGRHGPLPPLLVALTVVTGLVDAFSYLVLGHVFVANMTGNVVFLGFALVGAPGFSIARLRRGPGDVLVRGPRRRQGRRAAAAQHRGHLLTAAASLQARFRGRLGRPGRGEREPGLGRVSLPADRALMALAMGIQNATARKLAVPDLTTTVLTLTITGIAADSTIAGGAGSSTGRRIIRWWPCSLGALDRGGVRAARGASSSRW